MNRLTVEHPYTVDEFVSATLSIGFALFIVFGTVFGTVWMMHEHQQQTAYQQAVTDYLNQHRYK